MKFPPIRGGECHPPSQTATASCIRRPKHLLPASGKGDMAGARTPGNLSAARLLVSQSSVCRHRCAADTWSGCRGDDNTSRRTAASPFDAHMGARERALTLPSQASFSCCAGNFLLENFAAAGNASGRAADVKVKRARAGSADIDPRPAPMSLRQICHSSPTPPRRCFRRARRVPSRPAALSDL